MHWQWITLVYCAYLAIVSFLRPEFRGARPALVAGAAIAGLIAVTPVWPSHDRSSASSAFSALVSIRTNNRPDNR